MKPVADLQRVQAGISATAFLMVCVKSRSSDVTRARTAKLEAYT